MDLVDLLFEVFGDSEVGWEAAKVVGETASGGDDILTKSNHAIIKVSSPGEDDIECDLNAKSDPLCSKILQGCPSEDLGKAEGEFS